MRKIKENSMDWVFPKSKAEQAVDFIGARNLTLIDAIEFIGSGKERVLATWYDMVMYGDSESNERTKEWMQKVSDKYHVPGECYVYFRFKRRN